MIPVVLPWQMRAIDRAAPEPVEVLVERAGAAVERAAVRLMGGRYGRSVAVLAGPGNNGADGRVAADRLRDAGVQVHVYDALECPDVLPSFDLVIDAAFGTGFRGAWKPPLIGDARVLAVDIPTGLDATTGVASGQVLRADATVTFAAAKPGLVLGDGPELVGALEVADIGLSTQGVHIGIVEERDVARWLPSRDRGAHKWKSAIRVIAGSEGMTGAAALVSAAAQRAGAGMVVLSSPGIAGGIEAAPVEVVQRRLPAAKWAPEVHSDLHRFHALVVGPGMGRDEPTVRAMVSTVFDSVVPVVVDGDGLFALSWNEAGTPAFLREREVATVLTPHDGEFATLMGAGPSADRIASAHQLVQLSGAVVLLKGPTTVVASPDGRTRLITNGDERLATAGTGDVLAGVIGALIAGGAAPADAAAAGAWLHAEAARSLGRDGLVAGDLVVAIPQACNRARSIDG